MNPAITYVNVRLCMQSASNLWSCSTNFLSYTIQFVSPHVGD